MAHSALVSLMNTLELIVHSDRFHFFRVKHYVLSFYRKVRFLQTLLQDSAQKSREEETNSLETRIRDAVYIIEDMVESKILEQVLSDPESFILRIDGNSLVEEYQDLEEAIQDIDSIVEELLKDRCGLKGLLPRKYMPVGCSSKPARGGKRVMVGFDEDVMELKDRLVQKESQLQTIPIVGMGGIGKTTLARNLYDDLLMKEYFDVRAWVTISQTYLVHDILQTLLKDTGHAIDKQEEKSIQDLKESLYKNLKGRRYLVVLDDMWSTQVWDDLKWIFPDDINGSRIMLTTRLMNVAIYDTNSSSAPHQMRLLDHDQSWELLCHEVFAQEGCPPEFKEVEFTGKMIAYNCKGLPLSTSVIGRLLAKSRITLDFWEYVATNVSSIAIRSDECCSEILSLSYNHLPHHLKPCFLYFAVFPEDHEISVAKLIKLWIAEGMLRPIKSKSLEEVAEEYLQDLIDRNLVFVRREGTNGKIKACGIHDLVWDLCMKEAQKENFLHIINRPLPFSPSGKYIPRRLSMRLYILEDSDITDDLRNTMESMKHARSLLCTRYIESALPFCECFTLLRVLDLCKTDFWEFPDEILFLVNLRYLAIGFYTCPWFPCEMFLFWNLQVLVATERKILQKRKIMSPYVECDGKVLMSSEILQLASLRHLQVTECFLPNPIDDNNNVVILKDLKTLSTVANFRCTEEVLKKFPNLMKLGVYYYASDIGDWSGYHLENLVRFTKLENFKCIFNWPVGLRASLQNLIIFPPSLKKITLSFCKFDWKDMTIIGSLPNLEVLKLKDYAFLGPVWEPIEGEFCRLKHLQIQNTDLEQWIAENTHFPCLEHLIIWKCKNLKEVPCDIGEIATLKMIEIDDRSSSALASVEQILEEQQSMENYELQVCVHHTGSKSEED